MRFLIKTVFWLGLAFNAMEWPAGDSPAAAIAAAGAGMANASHTATAAGARLCVENAAGCLAIAAKAQNLTQAAAAAPPAAQAPAPRTSRRGAQG